MESKVTLACLVFSVTIGVIALVLSAVAFNKSSSTVTVGGGNPNAGGGAAGQGSGGGSNGTVNVQVIPNAQPKRRIFTIAHGHDWHAHEYIDAGGRVQGFSLKFLSEVCNAADMRCETIWEPYVNCWDSVAGQHQRSGVGLISRWYDGCMGWSMSVSRAHSLGFTDSYLGTVPAYFYKRAGDTTFDWLDVTGKKIGFMDGWVGDEKCLARQTGITGHVLPAANIKHYLTQPELVKGLISGEIQGAFGMEFELIMTPEQKTKITMGPNPYSCMLRGNAVIARKDNKDFIEGWNKGFRIIKENGKFKEMCDAAKNKNQQTVDLDCIK